MARIIGHARVSTDKQNLDIQQQAIEKYAEEQNMELIMYIEKVYKLDRLARSTKELYQMTDEMKNRGVDFVSINNNLDTMAPTGRAMLFESWS